MSIYFTKFKDVDYERLDEFPDECDFERHNFGFPSTKIHLQRILKEMILVFKTFDWMDESMLVEKTPDVWC
ncbi:hypothetical protein BS47DRAFT_1337945 [Hydnum rufescens UP504]|uniref:Uncharacterized protein n=1 Tax=Hydnum rufescens UP504 TaxID=1448309 RepID=A0A9P6E133_9AGAM|nr:hypothetical protein BS47DRAFT_1337945 [Hydnum rufescens UP504]